MDYDRQKKVVLLSLFRMSGKKVSCLAEAEAGRLNFVGFGGIIFWKPLMDTNQH